jgi:poly(hydroxyalkanoate) depolymerase family esterase
MSSLGWRGFVERVSRRGVTRVRESAGNRSAGNRRGWRPRRPVVRRRARRSSQRAAEGSWERRVDHGPTGSRSYALYTPAGLLPGTAVPLVVVLHGCNQSIEDAALGTGVNALADRAGFVALYPEQSDKDNMRRCWNWFNRRHQVRGSGEPAAIARITESVLSSPDGVRLDRNRVHAMGISAGGAMAGILAATYPDVYASVGIHSAPGYRAGRNAVTGFVAMKNGGPDPQRQGRLALAAMGSRARVVPVIVVQGDADRVVRAPNGEHVVRQWLSASRMASHLAAGVDFNRPHATYTDAVPGGLSYWVRTWNDSAGHPVVQYWLVSGLGHAWSGGAAAGSYTDPHGPNATQAMHRFFAQCPMDRDLAAPAATRGDRVLDSLRGRFGLTS